MTKRPKKSCQFFAVKFSKTTHRSWKTCFCFSLTQEFIALDFEPPNQSVQQKITQHFPVLILESIARLGVGSLFFSCFCSCFFSCKERSLLRYSWAGGDVWRWCWRWLIRMVSSDILVLPSEQLQLEVPPNLNSKGKTNYSRFNQKKDAWNLVSVSFYQKKDA